MKPAKLPFHRENCTAIPVTNSSEAPFVICDVENIKATIPSAFKNFTSTGVPRKLEALQKPQYCPGSQGGVEKVILPFLHETPDTKDL